MVCWDAMATRRTTTRTTPTPRAKQKREMTWAERIAALGDQISDEELANIPTDAARNLDHYLYGAPKQDWARRRMDCPILV